MSLNKILKIFSIGGSLAMLVAVAHAEQGEGTIRDPITGKYVNVYRDWQEGVVLNPATGDYTVTYKSADGSFNEVVFVPATKIDPTLKSKFKHSGDSDGIRYSYKLTNGARSKQNIDQIITLTSNVTAGTLRAPQGWSAHAVPQPPSQGPNLILSWSHFDGEHLSGLGPGKSLDGLSLESSDLPGIAVVKISGAAPTTEWLGHYPVGAVGSKMEEIDDRNNHIPRLAAVPRIPTGNPFDPILTLTGIQRHLTQDLISLKLVDPVFASQLDRSLQAAIDAAKLNNTKALKDHLKDLRRALKKEHDDVDKEDDDKDDEDGKPKPIGAIDKLAARVLNFDIKFVEKHVGGKND